MTEGKLQTFDTLVTLTDGTKRYITVRRHTPEEAEEAIAEIIKERGFIVAWRNSVNYLVEY